MCAATFSGPITTRRKIPLFSVVACGKPSVSTKRIREVRFEGVGVVRRATLGLYSKRWHGKHARTIRAVVVDAAGRTASSSVRACT